MRLETPMTRPTIPRSRRHPPWIDLHQYLTITQDSDGRSEEDHVSLEAQDFRQITRNYGKIPGNLQTGFPVADPKGSDVRTCSQ